jgi:hypothetical protein
MKKSSLLFKLSLIIGFFAFTIGAANSFSTHQDNVREVEAYTNADYNVLGDATKAGWTSTSTLIPTETSSGSGIWRIVLVLTVGQFRVGKYDTWNQVGIYTNLDSSSTAYATLEDWNVRNSGGDHNLYNTVEGIYEVIWNANTSKLFVNVFSTSKAVATGDVTPAGWSTTNTQYFVGSSPNQYIVLPLTLNGSNSFRFVTYDTWDPFANFSKVDWVNSTAASCFNQTVYEGSATDQNIILLTSGLYKIIWNGTNLLLNYCSADDYATYFLANTTTSCSAMTAPTNWSALGTYYSSLPVAEQTALTSASVPLKTVRASDDGTLYASKTNVEKCAWRYVIIVEAQSVNNFMNRGDISSSHIGLFSTNSLENIQIILVILISTFALTMIAGYFFIRKKKTA